MPLSAEARTARAQLASVAARAAKSPDDDTLVQELDERRREYRYIAARDYITEVVAGAPPLSDDQRIRLSRLLAGKAGGA